MGSKKCEKKDKECWKKVVGWCRDTMKDCKGEDMPKKCFWEKVKEAKKEKEEKENDLEELRGGRRDKKKGGKGKKKACAMKIKKNGWCEKSEEPKKCWAGKMKACMSKGGKKEEKEEKADMRGEEVEELKEMKKMWKKKMMMKKKDGKGGPSKKACAMKIK